MDKIEILEIPNFEYTPQGFKELTAVLKEGKALRNPFAKFYGEKVEVVIDNAIINNKEDNQFKT